MAIRWARLEGKKRTDDGAQGRAAGTLGSLLLLWGLGCGGSGASAGPGPEELDPSGMGDVGQETLSNRAYVVSAESNDVFVVDLGNLQQIAKVDSSVSGAVNENHMAMLSREADKLYVLATHENAAVVINTRTLRIEKRIAIGDHPTHASACFGCPPDGRDLLWVVNEGPRPAGGESAGAARGGPTEASAQGSVSIIDMLTDEVIASLAHPSMMSPHSVRFSERSAYVPSIAGNQITVIDLDSWQVSEVLMLEGQAAPSACSGDPCGFADAQIDASGLLVAAHIETGRVLSYDTRRGERYPDMLGGNRPWAVFVDSLSDELDTHLMPNWGDETVSLIDRNQRREVGRSPAGDRESYGVNYSPLAPGRAFVLNRQKERITVIDRLSGELIESLDVGGTTETASTTKNGRHLLLPISSTNQLSIFDVATRTEVARFDDVGVYPWSVTTPGGQNYCH